MSDTLNIFALAREHGTVSAEAIKVKNGPINSDPVYMVKLNGIVRYFGSEGTIRDVMAHEQAIEYLKKHGIKEAATL